MEQLELGTGLSPQSAQDLMTDSYLWICAHPRAWDMLVGAAQRDALDGVPVRMKAYVETLRARHDIEWASREFKIPNALTAGLTRILVAWYPELKPFVRISASKLDGCVIPEMPR